MGAVRASLLLVLVASVLGPLACAGGTGRSGRGPGPACVTLAKTFFVIAAHKNRGVTREEQLELVHAAAGDRSERTLRHWVHVIDLVYRYSDASAREISFTVLDQCRVDAQGRASVQTLWPTR
jgi:hypothetical protein